MKTRTLGNSGIEVSAVGLGCNSLGGRIDLDASRKVVNKALDLGITFFDTANTYGNRYGAAGGSESCLGELLGARRKDIVLATKFGCQSGKHPSMPVEGASRGEIMDAVHASLRRLRTDWIDLYQMHHPDPRTPIDETLRALDDLVTQGKVRAIGCSNIPAARLDEAQQAAVRLGVPGFAACQMEYSALVRGIERELLPLMAQHGVSLLPFYPLAGGLLTGKYKRDSIPPGTRFATQKRLADRFFTDAHLATVERLERCAAGHGRTLLELAFGWLLARPAVASVIAGATTAEQVAANVNAAAWPLSGEHMAEIDAIFAGPNAPRRAGASATQTGELR